MSIKQITVFNCASLVVYLHSAYTALRFVQLSDSPTQSHSAPPPQSLSFYLRHTQDLPQCCLLSLTLCMSNFWTNETTTSRKSLLDAHRRVLMLPHAARRPCRSIFAPQTSIWLLSLLAMLAEQSLS